MSPENETACRWAAMAAGEIPLEGSSSALAHMLGFHFRRVLSRVEELERELKLWRPLTPEEAEQALNDAQAVPISEEVFARILAKATDPAERVTNNEAAQMAARIAELEATAETVAKALRSGPIHTDYQGWCTHLAELLARKEGSQ